MKKWVEREKRLINKQFEKMKKNVNGYNIEISIIEKMEITI